ncbi:hypothetical protein EB093_08725 [bacterium]|nr:hypothetical protein [bacterium]
MTTKETADIVERLRVAAEFKNRSEKFDGPNIIHEAADEIERLRGELKIMREDKWKPLIKVHRSDCPTDEYRGVPVCVSDNRVWPWPADNVVLYAALKEGE